MSDMGKMGGRGDGYGGTECQALISGCAVCCAKSTAAERNWQLVMPLIPVR